MSEPITVELHTPETRPQREQLAARTWRGISGAFTVGLVLLAIATVAVQWYAGGRDLPGLGWDVVTGHWIMAALAVVCQIFADRRRGWKAALFSLGALTVGFTGLWIYWWA
ncbi:hypothetical protein ACFFQW_39030 [Umezawaea endophytica]|uniref:Uncharacterized protein n=1 Tax=Umezawaea endophytica TaxID=1654476 RepID=A0A9X2VNJ9_9PSEU|nr:hypothetical protein [Umezawaea endophytica]MCS7479719.1 hypothetical protein [Umezawaea endophytica]